MKVAAIGIGSNSVRMLEADITGNTFVRVCRDRAGTRLFAGLDEAGLLNRESMLKTVSAVRGMAEKARREGCEKLDIFATSAARDAKNGEEFIRLVREAAHAEPDIISGEEEALLGFLGASDVLAGCASRGVIDIGGGSTELAVGSGNRIDAAFSCQMGAVRLYNMLPVTCSADMDAVENTAVRILDETLGEKTLPAAEEWVGTGGTFTTLAAMVKGICWTDRTYMHGTRLLLPEIREIGRKLADMTVEERLTLPGLQPGRADIVVHGICILLGVMGRLGIGQLCVSEYGNLDGYIKRKYLTL